MSWSHEALVIVRGRGHGTSICTCTALHCKWWAEAHLELMAERATGEECITISMCVVVWPSALMIAALKLLVLRALAHRP